MFTAGLTPFLVIVLTALQTFRYSPLLSTEALYGKKIYQVTVYGVSEYILRNFTNFQQHHDERHPKWTSHIVHIWEIEPGALV